MTKKSYKLKEGYGNLFRNSFKEDNQPDFRGTIALSDELLEAAEEDGELSLSAWIVRDEDGDKKLDKNGNSYFSISIQEVFKNESKFKSKKKAVKVDDMDDDDDF